MRALLVLLVLAGTASAQVPGTINFTARLVDDKTGVEATGSHRASFALFEAEAGGTALWTEDADIEVEDGLVFYDLGTTTPLDGSVFDGRRVFLEVAIDGERLEPRIALGSVPYAVRSTEATNAAMVGGVAAELLQKRITGACSSGNFVIGVNSDGSVACGPDLSGTGDITDVLAGSGLQGGGTTGSVTLSLVNCGLNEVLKFNGTAWACAQDLSNPGDITSVVPGTGGGLTGGGTSGDVALSIIPCGTNQILRFNGAWACSEDQNSGGTITGITTSGNSGLVGGTNAGNATLSLLTNCGNNQLLKFSVGTGSWGCANDNDSGGDVQDVIGGAGLTATGTTSITLNVGAGQGITVAADTVALDTAFTDNRYDPRYVNANGDQMSGTLNMNGNPIIGRGCPAGFVKHGPICLEANDVGGLTFSACTNRCRGQSAHVCGSGELRAVMQSGIAIEPVEFGVLGDWADDMATTTTVFVINSGTDTNNWVALAQTSTAAFCRCCTNVE